VFACDNLVSTFESFLAVAAVLVGTWCPIAPYPLSHLLIPPPLLNRARSLLLDLFRPSRFGQAICFWGSCLFLGQLLVFGSAVGFWASCWLLAKLLVVGASCWFLNQLLVFGRLAVGSFFGGQLVVFWGAVEFWELLGQLLVGLPLGVASCWLVCHWVWPAVLWD
jgi:hypothetical protein